MRRNNRQIENGCIFLLGICFYQNFTTVLFEALYACRQDAPFSGIAERGILLQLIAAFLKESNASYTDSGKYGSHMQEVLQYIHDNLDKNVTVNELARLLGYSDDHFTKKFKEAFGCSPRRYISNLKINQAIKLLRTTDMPISEISASLGFCDAGYFANFFHSKTGIFPSYYRAYGKDSR